MHRIVYRAGQPTAVLAVELHRGGREVFLDAFAIGDGARHLQGALIGLGLEATLLLAGDDPDARVDEDADPYELSAAFWHAVAGAYVQDAGYQEVLRGRGFRPIRRFWQMLLDITHRLADEPAPPAGATRRAVGDEADRRLLHALYLESFAGHFGMTHEEPFDEWIAELAASEGSDPGLWWIAELDGRPVGLCVLDDSKAEFGEGYVKFLGVVPSARGRGVARWLLRCAAADSVARGRTGLALSVDGANDTGATALYESEGFAVRHALDVFCYPVVDSASSR
jgi:ribosomal protein S18 acetylase RimI-like enzyme